MATISIIVPVYNVDKYLDKCIKSILEQTFKDFELILVNDGSKDKSEEICEYYKEKDKRVKVINKENGGVSSARNAGLKIAEGKYVGFVDQDDWIDNIMYEKMYEVIMDTKSDIVICDFCKEYEGKIISKQKNKNIKNKVEIFNNIQALEQLYKVKYTYVVAWNKLYKRELFNDIKYKEGVICEDEFIIHHLYFQSKRVVHIYEEMYHYFQRPGSIINSSYNIKRLDKIKALNQRIKFFKNINQYNLMYKAEKDYWDSMIWSYFLVKNKITHSKQALRDIKMEFYSVLIDLLRNPLISWNNKIMIVIFGVNSTIYRKLTRLV